MHGRIRASCALGLALAGSLAVPALAASTTVRVSVGPGGAQANCESAFPSLSADGRFLTFHSQASNLVPGDTNGAYDVFVRDLTMGKNTRVSVGPGGAQSVGGGSFEPAISADGRFVAFSSQARNLVPGDTNGQLDIFVRDLVSGTTRRLSVGSGGAQANDDGVGAAISGDGGVAVFYSIATNLVPGDRNNWDDVFLRDLRAGRTPPGSASGRAAPRAMGSAGSRPWRRRAASSPSGRR